MWRNSRCAPKGRAAASAVAKTALSVSLPEVGTRMVFILDHRNVSTSPPHRVPFAERSRQIAPGRPSPHDPRYCFDEPPIIPARPSEIALLTRHKRSNAFPLTVAQQHAALHFAALNHNPAVERIFCATPESICRIKLNVYRP